MISAIGRIPAKVAPIHAPMNPVSANKESITLSRPNSVTKSFVTPNGPPQASSAPGMWSLPAPPATSSPIKMTEGSFRISKRIASLTASLYVS